METMIITIESDRGTRMRFEVEHEPHFAGMGLIAGGLAVIDGRLLPGLLARKAGRGRDTGRGDPRREPGRPRVASDSTPAEDCGRYP